VLNQIDQIEACFTERAPQVRAFLTEDGRFDRLRREARQLIDRFPQPDRRPPHYDVLVGVKDIFRVDGFPTRAGSRLPPDLFAGAEAESVTRLKQAGALILGKTVSTEFAYFAPGPTRNPHHLQHNRRIEQRIGGSSGRRSVSCGAGHPNDRIDHSSGCLLWRDWLQAKLRSRLLLGRDPVLAFT
jgi:Asp-tRNA(Asn)/Glu-tRNA(Gln) amidotransferase A subunit family amidase